MSDFEHLREKLQELALEPDDYISVQAQLALDILDEIERIKEQGPEIDMSNESPRVIFHPEPEITKRFQIISQILSSISQYVISKQNLELKKHEVEARVRYLETKIWQMQESVLQKHRALEIQEEIAKKKLMLKQFEDELNYQLKEERLMFERERFEKNFEKWQKEYELKKERLEIMKKLKGVMDVDEAVKELLEVE